MDYIQTTLTIFRRPFDTRRVLVRVVVQAIDVEPANRAGKNSNIFTEEQQPAALRFKDTYKINTKSFLGENSRIIHEQKQSFVTHHAGIDILMFKVTGIVGLQKKRVSLKPDLSRTT